MVHFPRVLLVDNGSVEPAGTLQLRRVAQALAVRSGAHVDPVSLAHSTKVAAAALGGRPAELFAAGLDRVLAEGAREVVVLPLFIGPSYAIVRQVPALVAERAQRHPAVRFLQAAPLFVPGEKRLAGILADHIHGQRPAGARVRVAIVDHGSPSRAVAEVRDAVTDQVRERLSADADEVVACSMERRPGAEFDFNEPTLTHLLAREGWRSDPLIVALLFIAPGKHAGPGGDVARLVAEARGGARSDVVFTPVLGEHPALIDVLADRLRTVRGDAA